LKDGTWREGERENVYTSTEGFMTLQVVFDGTALVVVSETTISSEPGFSVEIT
jgi:hypothetical protein